MQVRLYPSVEATVKLNARASKRSFAKEINYALALYYAKNGVKIKTR